MTGELNEYCINLERDGTTHVDLMTWAHRRQTTHDVKPWFGVLAFPLY